MRKVMIQRSWMRELVRTQWKKSKMRRRKRRKRRKMLSLMKCSPSLIFCLRDDQGVLNQRLVTYFMVTIDCKTYTFVHSFFIHSVVYSEDLGLLS